jgi:glycosyltransferase involved in cell wall biosynthesis
MIHISIVTVTYNAEKTIDRCLKSVAEQKEVDGMYEHIIIDGLSRDRTMDIVLKYSSKIDKIISESDGGISDAFNKGLHLSKGKYVIFLSADDYFLDENVLSDVLCYFITDADIYVGSVINNSCENKRTLVMPPKSYRSLLFDMTVNHPAMFAKRSALISVKGFDVSLNLAMDYKQCLLLYLNRYRFESIQRVITIVSEQGISHMNYISSRKEVRDIQSENVNYFCSRVNFIYSIFRYSLRKLIQLIGLNIIVNIYRSYFSKNKKIIL